MNASTSSSSRASAARGQDFSFPPPPSLYVVSGAQPPSSGAGASPSANPTQCAGRSLFALFENLAHGPKAPPAMSVEEASSFARFLWDKEKNGAFSTIVFCSRAHEAGLGDGLGWLLFSSMAQYGWIEKTPGGHRVSALGEAVAQGNWRDPSAAFACAVAQSLSRPVAHQAILDGQGWEAFPEPAALSAFFHESAALDASRAQSAALRAARTQAWLYWVRAQNLFQSFPDASAPCAAEAAALAPSPDLGGPSAPASAARQRRPERLAAPSGAVVEIVFSGEPSAEDYAFCAAALSARRFAAALGKKTPSASRRPARSGSAEPIEIFSASRTADEKRDSVQWIASPHPLAAALPLSCAKPLRG